MDHTKFPSHVREWMQNLEQSVNSSPEQLTEYCDKLEQYASEVRSDYLRGYSLFFRGIVFYTQAQLEDSIRALSSALNDLLEEDDWFMIARTYNAMGNISDVQGDLSLAIDCYCKGLVISREHDLGLLSYSISSNLANIHLSLGQLDHAVDMLLSCERLVESGLVPPASSQLVVHANLASCCTRLGELDKAKKYFDILARDCNASPTETNRVTLCILAAELFHATGDIDARDNAIAELHRTELQASLIFDALSELCHHATLLLELNKYEEFLSLVEQIEHHSENPNVEKMVLDLRLKYYQKIGDKENSAKAAVKFYEITELREGMRCNIVSHNILTRMHLGEESAKRKEIERINLQLKQKSERDPLTGMNNRYKLNEISELAFHRSYISGTPLTVEILDIDYYKEYNDNYGHQAGDECLIRVAEAIRSLEEYPNVHTARYGGDEFVIIYEGYPRSDIEQMVQILQRKIHALNIEHNHSKVSDRITVSQGVFHRIPSGGNKTWDFLHCADLALYGVKHRSKNNYYIGSSLKEVQEFNNQFK